MEFKLKKLKNVRFKEKPLLLIIMDGVGIGCDDESNGLFLARTPNLDSLFRSGFFTSLQAHGTAVGLPTDEDMGNSEVGHNALGAGRVFAQGAKRVDEAINSGAIYRGETWKKALSNVFSNSSTFHFIGLLSDGNVHSNDKHLFNMLERAKKEGVKRVRVHTLLDGRDVPERSALEYLSRLREVLVKLSDGDADYRIASGGGRMVTTMDRYNADWSVVENGWKAHVLGQARTFSSAEEAVRTFYKEDPEITDQYLPSFIIAEDGSPVGTINDGDSVVFFNFRGDRSIEISKAFECEEFKEFDRKRRPRVFYAGIMEYDGDLHIPKNYLVFPPSIDRTLSEYLCAEGVEMFAVSETQKFGHVTYFWNGNKSGYVCPDREKYIEIPSDKIEFDKAPEMKANEITDSAIALLQEKKYSFGRLNLANGDMVGHTAKKDAIIRAMETVDFCVGRLLEEVRKLGGRAIVTSDHGNSEELFTVSADGKRSAKTAHSLNPVPFIIYDPSYEGGYRMRDLPKRGLSNVAGTVLNLLGYENVKDYDPSLIEII